MLEVDWFDLRQTRTSGLNHVLHSSLLLHCLVFKEHRADCLNQLLYITSKSISCQILFKVLTNNLFSRAALFSLATCIILYVSLYIVNSFL